MRPVCVVELLELAQCVEQVPLVPDQGAVEQFAAAGLHPPVHDRIHSRHLAPLSTAVMPASLSTASNRAGNLPSRSRIRNRARLPATSRSMTRFLAAWATQ